MEFKTWFNTTIKYKTQNKIIRRYGLRITKNIDELCFKNTIDIILLEYLLGKKINLHIKL